MTAKFGVCLPNFGKHLSPDAITTVAAEAEEMGFSSVWATDHLIIPTIYKYPYGNILEALTTMTLAAAATEEVNIGSSVIVLPMREPVSVAKAMAAIDVISRGRVIAGFGAGWCEGEFKNLGQNKASKAVDTQGFGPCPEEAHGIKRFHGFKSNPPQIPVIYYGGEK